MSSQLEGGLITHSENTSCLYPSFQCLEITVNWRYVTDLTFVAAWRANFK